MDEQTQSEAMDEEATSAGYEIDGGDEPSLALKLDPGD
jgi:hypothetical protein